MRAAEDLAGALRPGLRGSWERFWFGEASLVRLSAFRIVALAVALYAVEMHVGTLLEIGAENELLERRWVPIYLLELIGFGPPSPEVVRALHALLVGAIVLGVVGLLTRVACTAAAVLVLLWMGTAYSYGQPHHEFGLLAFALLALPFGPVGRRLSLDGVIARVSSARREPRLPQPPERAALAATPLRFVQVSAAISYFFAGSTKLRYGGVDWLNGYTLQAILLEYDAPLTDAVAANLWLVRAMSVAVVGAQVLLPLAVVWRPSRWVLVPGVVAFHVGSSVTMATGPFLGLWALLACFVDLERVPGFLRRRVARGSVAARAAWLAAALLLAAYVLDLYAHFAPAWALAMLLPLAPAVVLGLLPRARADLVHDGACGTCRRAMVLVRALDWSGRLRILDATRREELARHHPELSRDACAEDVHLVASDGRVRRGFDAYRAAAWRLPLTLPLAPLLHLPGVAGLGERVYRHVADTRASGACALEADRPG